MRRRLWIVLGFMAAGLAWSACGRAAELRERSKEHSDRKDYGAALDDIRLAIAADPRSAWAHYHLGWLLSETEGCASALPSYDEALRLDPSFWKAYLNRGYCVLQLERFEEALTDLSRVVEHAADRGWRLMALDYRAQCYRMLGRDEDCRRDQDELERER